MGSLQARHYADKITGEYKPVNVKIDGLRNEHASTHNECSKNRRNQNSAKNITPLLRRP